MELVLWRYPSTQHSTPGDLYLNGEFECYTLEDVVREVPGKPVKEWKVKGETAIPFGKYKIEITYSPRFKRDLPLLLDVPGFTGIRIHPGNRAADTEGCILVGRWRDNKDEIRGSRIAFDTLFKKLQGAQNRSEPITIWIRKY